MAVQEQTPRIEYAANGATTSFPLTFDCEDQDYLIVTIDDNESSVGSWQLIDNSVVFRTAPAAGSTVTMQRNSPFERTTTYQTYNNSFRPGPVNKDLDRIWWKLQELGLADWLLSKRLDKEIQDRILADLALKADYISRDKILEKDYIQRDAALKKYIDSMIALVTGDASFNGIDAAMVADSTGMNQQDVNDQYARRTNKVFYAVDYGLKESNSAYLNTLALQLLSAAVNKNSGGRVVFPSGLYEIGHQVLAGAGDKGGSWLFSQLFHVSNCKNALLLEFNQTVLKFKDGMRHGAFDPITGLPVANGGIIKKYDAGYGRAIELRSNEDVRIIGQLRIDGNDKNSIIGGTYGDKGRQNVSYGVFAVGNKLLSSSGSFVLHNIPLDGLYVSSLNSNESKTDMNGIVSIKNARQALSLTGGWNQTYTSCYFGKTGMGDFPSSAPAANLDLEAEITGEIKNANFDYCVFSDAVGGSIISEFNSARDVNFNNCLIENSRNVSIYCKSSLKFNNCKINGKVEPFYSRYKESPAVINDCKVTQYMEDGSKAFIAGSLFSDGGSRSTYSNLIDLTVDYNYDDANNAIAFYSNSEGNSGNIILNISGNPKNVSPPIVVSINGGMKIDGFMVNDTSQYDGLLPDTRKSVGGAGLKYLKNAFISKNKDGDENILWNNDYYSSGARSGWWSGGNIDVSGSYLEPKELSILKNKFGSSDYYGGGQIISSASSVPNKGWWRFGTIIFNYNPAVGKPLGWICIKEGVAGAADNPAIFAKLSAIESL